MNWYKHSKVKKFAQMQDGVIHLTDNETKIFGFLQQINSKYKLNTIMRVAGGWVRDKCLGKESHDIDIALDNMTGKQFTEYVTREIGKKSHIIEQRPDQSKHLETATIEIFGQSIDFVNLRDESFGGAYDQNRILTENRFGSPKVDAERRDFTINSLFYNINDGQVEDYVGGLKDLGFEGNNRVNPVVLKTPLDATKTLLDDPLRLLRGMRFLSKLPDAKLDPSFVEAMKNPSVQEAFAKKISPERIGDELIGVKEKDGAFKPGILSGARFEEAMRMMHDTGILDKVMQVPEMEGFHAFEMPQRNSHHKYDVFNHTLMLMKNLKTHPYTNSLPPEKQSLMLMAALLHDVGKLDPSKQQVKEDGSYSYHGHEDSSTDVSKAIMKKLRRSNDQVEYVSGVVQHHMKPHAEGWGSDKALRRFMMDHPEIWQDVITHAEMDNISSGTPRSSEELAKYKGYRDRGLELQEQKQVPSNKPLIDGKTLMSLFSELNPKTGFIREVNQILMDKKLDNPDISEEELLQEVQRIKPEILSKYKI